MSDARLTNLTILSIERELADEIDFDDVISVCCSESAKNSFVSAENVLWLNKYLWLVVYADFCLNW